MTYLLFLAAFLAGLRFGAALRVVFRVVAFLRGAALRAAGLRFGAVLLFGAAFFKPKVRHLALIDASERLKVLAHSGAVLDLYIFFRRAISAADHAFAPALTAAFFLGAVLLAALLGAALRVVLLAAFLGAALRAGFRFGVAFLLVVFFVALRIGCYSVKMVYGFINFNLHHEPILQFNVD